MQHVIENATKEFFAVTVVLCSSSEFKWCVLLRTKHHTIILTLPTLLQLRLSLHVKSCVAMCESLKPICSMKQHWGSEILWELHLLPTVLIMEHILNPFVVVNNVWTVWHSVLSCDVVVSLFQLRYYYAVLSADIQYVIKITRSLNRCNMNCIQLLAVWGYVFGIFCCHEW